MNEQEIFNKLLELETAAEQAAFLNQSCGNDSNARSRLEELLQAHREASGFLESPAFEASPTLPDNQDTDPEDANTNSNPEQKTLLCDESVESSLDFLEPAQETGRIGQLGPYEIIEKIGQGGMGVVLKAFDPHLNRIVAIKTLAPDYANNPVARKRFAREAQAAAAVTHPHVVTIHAVEPAGKIPFLVMEYIQGQSLREKLDRVGLLEVREILRIGAQIAQGLAAAHEQGLIHRDIKPGNVLLENGVERVKLTDFGLARATDDVAITRTGEIAGTPQYMSPEQAEGRTVDTRSDLFSLGSVLYAMCTGQPPFRGDTVVAVLRKVCDSEPRAIRDLNPDIPHWLVDIIDHLLAKDPEHRFQTASEVASLLNEHLANLQNPSSGSKPKFERRLPKQKPRSYWMRFAMFLILPSIVCAVGFLIWTLLSPPVPVEITMGEITVALGDAWSDTSTELFDDEGNPIAPHDSTLAPFHFHYTKLKPGRYWVKIHAADAPNDVQLWRAVDLDSGGAQTVHGGDRLSNTSPQPDVTVSLVEWTGDNMTYRICNRSDRPIYQVGVRTPIYWDNATRRARMFWDWGRHGVAPGDCVTQTLVRYDLIPPFLKSLETVIDYVDYGEGDVWKLDNAASLRETADVPERLTNSLTNHHVRRRLERREKLKQIGLALNNHFEAFGHFPPSSKIRGSGTPSSGRMEEHKSETATDAVDGDTEASNADGADGYEVINRNRPDPNWRPNLSWRVYLLPFLEEQPLFEKFNFNEPWDSPHNLKLLSEMPDVYNTGHPTRTSLLAVVGEGTAYEGGAGLEVRGFTDGLSNIAYVVDAGLSRAVPWTKPEDLPFDAEDPIRAFGEPEFGDTFQVVMADASSKTVPYNTDPEMLRALFLRDDGKVLDLTKKRTTPLPETKPQAGSAGELLQSGKWEWRVVENLSETIPLKGTIKGGTMTADGRTLIFGVLSKSGEGEQDLFMCRRDSIEQPWSVPVNLGPKINTVDRETGPALSPDGLSLLFSRGYIRTFETTRKSMDASWSEPEPFDIIDSFGAPDVTASGRELAVSLPNGDIAVAERVSVDAPWPTPVVLGPEVNSKRQEKEATISDDGRLLLFSRTESARTHELFLSTRADTKAAWSSAISLTESLGIENAHHARLLPDGVSFLFVGNATGTEKLYLARLVKKIEANSQTDAVSQAAPDRRALIALRLVADRDGGLASASVHIGHRFEPIKTQSELEAKLGPEVPNRSIEAVIQVDGSLKYGELRPFLLSLLVRVNQRTPTDVAIPGDKRPPNASNLPNEEAPFKSIVLELRESRERFVFPVFPHSSTAESVQEVDLLDDIRVQLSGRSKNEVAIRLRNRDLDLGTGTKAIQRLDAEISKAVKSIEDHKGRLHILLIADDDVSVGDFARAMQACRVRRKSAEQWVHRPTELLIGPDTGFNEESAFEELESPLPIDFGLEKGTKKPSPRPSRRNSIPEQPKK